MDSVCCSGPDKKITPVPGTNQIAGFVEFGFPPAHELRKKYIFFNLYVLVYYIILRGSIIMGIHGASPLSWSTEGVHAFCSPHYTHAVTNIYIY